MKNLITILMLAVFAFSGCKKTTTPSPSTPTTPSATTNTIQLINNSANPYDIYINAAYKTRQSGGTSITFTYSFGSYAIEVRQASGYVLYPTVKNYSGTLSATNNIIISYP